MKIFRLALLLVLLQIVYSSCVASAVRYTGKGVIIENAENQELSSSSIFVTDSDTLTLKKEKIIGILPTIIFICIEHIEALHETNARAYFSPSHTNYYNCPVFITTGCLII